MRPTERFSQTVHEYVQYRPSYPQAVIETLKSDCGLNPTSVLADIGSGTGLLTKLLLQQGNLVYGVEPNAQMREAGELFLKQFTNFISVDGSAEATTLSAHTIDIITVATAFHWFDVEKTQVEFKRILKSPGWLLLVWNVRDLENSPMLNDYEQLIIEYGRDYQNSRANKFDETVTVSFFKPYEMHTKTFNNRQQFDWEGFKGRLLSASYSLREGDLRYEEMLLALRKIFDRYQKNNKIEFLYATKVYYGRLR